MNYKDVVVEENEGKVYICKLKNGQTLELQVHDDCKSSTANFVMYSFEDSEDTKEYLEEDVEEVLEQIEHDWCDQHEDSFENINTDLIDKYLIDSDVWQYSNREELDEILKALNQPIIEGGGWNDKEDEAYLNSLPKDYGIVFYWSEYDDFNCYGDGFTHHVKVISCVKKV